MKTQFPVYDICNLSEGKEDTILVRRFARYLEEHKNLHLPHKHNFYHLVMFTQGGGSHSIDFENFPVKPYEIYFMIPGQVHSWDFEGFADGYIINFSADFFQSFLLNPNYLHRFPFFSGNAAEGVLSVPESYQQKLRMLFEEVMKEKSTAGSDADYLRTLILQIFISVNRFTPQKTGGQINYNYILLNNFKNLIENHFLTLRLPREYAELLYVTPNHLNALCNDILGLSAGELIRKRVSLEAKRLLINLDLSVSEIAYRLNFNDNSYFSKFFKKLEGLSPEEFRKKAFESTLNNK